MKARPLIERFWEKVKKAGPDDCWLWLGSRIQNRYKEKTYGKINKGGRGEGEVYAHRLSYEIHHGAVPKGKFVMHSCDTPHCVNPAHLSVGTHQDNMDDMMAKGRHGASGPKVGTGAKNTLTKEQVMDIIVSPLSQDKVAKKYGIGQSTVSRIRLGNSCQNLI